MKCPQCGQQLRYGQPMEGSCDFSDCYVFKSPWHKFTSWMGTPRGAAVYFGIGYALIAAVAAWLF